MNCLPVSQQTLPPCPFPSGYVQQTGGALSLASRLGPNLNAATSGSGHNIDPLLFASDMQRDKKKELGPMNTVVIASAYMATDASVRHREKKALRRETHYRDYILCLEKRTVDRHSLPFFTEREGWASWQTIFVTI